MEIEFIATEATVKFSGTIAQDTLEEFSKKVVPDQNPESWHWSVLRRMITRGEGHWKSLLIKANKSYGGEAKVHCEAALAVHIITNKLKPGRYFLGCYKLSCLGCHHFINAMNTYCAEQGNGYTFVVDGTHGYPYIPYAAPAKTPTSAVKLWNKELLSYLCDKLGSGSKTTQKRLDSSVGGPSLASLKSASDSDKGVFESLIHCEDSHACRYHY
ncbi:hypothetical protein C8Q80DRAFT_914805 [Daedaleopsis nitida]|nr:hypothetical protein C8Q80DRAFT_914805 [Daedaleopsis nitida]